MTDPRMESALPPALTPENRGELLAGTPLLFRMMLRYMETLDYGSVVMQLPNGRSVLLTSGNPAEETAVIRIRDYAMAWRTLTGGTIGCYESYADEQWETPDLAQLLYVLARNVETINRLCTGNPVFQTFNKLVHRGNRNTKSGSRRNIMAHYDLGNAFYEKWLDPSMTYSSALFASPDQPLEAAQEEKYRALAEQIGLREGDHVLEIGSGWGGFAEVAAKHYGAKVTGLTISPEQHAYASARMQREGLNDRVEIRLQDYRDVDGQFDRIASIEMFEAVGKEYWPAYFSKVHDVLKEGGKAGLQIITIADHLYPDYAKGVDFIQRYVFPGGMLPSPGELDREFAGAGLRLEKVRSFGIDYATTLRQWHDRFLATWDDLTGLGFDDRFRKLWRFYLAYCEAGFRAGTTDVAQFSVVRA